MQKRQAKQGAKQLNVPAAYGSRKSKVQQVKYTSRANGVVVRNEEFLAMMDGVTSFSVSQYAINPGLVNTFPWLSNIAANYEFYRFKKLVVHYRPIVGTMDSGIVIMAADYDALDFAPSTIQEIMTYKAAVNGPLYQDHVLRFGLDDMARFTKARFVRNTPVPSGADAKTYDVAMLNVANECTSATRKGSIHLEYEVEFFTPAIPTNDPALSSGKLICAACSKAQPLLNAIATNANPADPVVKVGDTSRFKLGLGEYLITTDFFGTGLSSSTLQAIAAISAGAATISNINSTLGVGNTMLKSSDRVNVTKPDTEFTLSIPGGWTTLTDTNLRIAPYDYGL